MHLTHHECSVATTEESQDNIFSRSCGLFGPCYVFWHWLTDLVQFTGRASVSSCSDSTFDLEKGEKKCTVFENPPPHSFRTFYFLKNRRRQATIMCAPPKRLDAFGEEDDSNQKETPYEIQGTTRAKFQKCKVTQPATMAQTSENPTKTSPYRFRSGHECVEPWTVPDPAELSDDSFVLLSESTEGEECHDLP